VYIQWYYSSRYLGAHGAHFLSLCSLLSTTSLLDPLHTPLRLNTTTLPQRRLYVINSQTSSRPPRSTTSRKARLLSPRSHGPRRGNIKEERERERESNIPAIKTTTSEDGPLRRPLSVYIGSFVLYVYSAGTESLTRIIYIYI